MIFIKATEDDLDELAELFDTVCDYLEAHDNYPNWKKGVYPDRETAETGIKTGTQYLCKEDDRIIGTVRISHEPEAGYRDVSWRTADDYERIFVIYTLAVHPDFMGKGIGLFLLECAEKMAREKGMVSLRLDAVKGNIPAEKLYEKAGYEFITVKSLGYEEYGIPWYDLYEKVLAE